MAVPKSTCSKCGYTVNTSDMVGRKEWTKVEGKLLCPSCNGKAPKQTKPKTDDTKRNG